MMPQWHHHHC
jgi:hypothetical protein